MAETSSRIKTLPRPGEASPHPRRRRFKRPRRAAVRLAGVLALALVAIAAAAVIPGSHSHRNARFSVHRLNTSRGAANPLGVRITKVLGSDTPARRYGTQDALRDQGVNAQGQMASDLSPLPPAWFDGPVKHYRSYAERWSTRLAGDVGRLTATLRGPSRAAAKRAWDVAFADFQQLGAVYGLLPNALQRRLVGMPPSLGQRRFPGLHRLELGLWTGQPLHSLTPVGVALGGTVAELRRALPRVAISPLTYATRAHEILEDAQRDFLSGTEVPWSGQGVLATAAAASATREVISTLVPLLQGRDNTLALVQAWLAQLQATLRAARRPDGSWPAVDALTASERERIDGTLTASLVALSQIPATLETTQVPEIPTIAAQERAR